MGVREILGALARRWYVVVIGLVLSLGAGWFVYDNNPPEYTARSLVLLLPPQGTGEEAQGSNPFLQLGGLELTARVLVATYSSTSFANEVEERSPDAEVTVSVDDSTRGGVIIVEVKDATEESALAMLDYVTDSVSTRLDDLQSEVGVTGTASVRSMLLTKDTEGEPDFQALTRLLVVAVGGGLAVTFALVLVTAFLAGQRQRRRRGLTAPTVRKGRSGASTREPTSAPKPGTGPEVDSARSEPVSADSWRDLLGEESSRKAPDTSPIRRPPSEPRSARRSPSGP